MRRFINRLIICLGEDDLFLRVVFSLAGLLFGGIGVGMLWGATDDLGSPLFHVVYWVLAISLTAGGVLLGSLCVLWAQSAMARFLDKFVPDAVGLEEGAFLIIAIYLPAVLVTLLLRFLGVRGQ
jgi:hypothetical protein